MRTQAPLKTPTHRVPVPGRSLTSLAGPLIRALHQVDAACMQALNQSAQGDALVCARLEVAMWAPLHRALSSHLAHKEGGDDQERIDALLADDLLGFVDDVLLWVADVAAGGERRAGRYLGACRQRLGELAAFGGETKALQQQLTALEAKMAAAQASAAASSAATTNQDWAVPLAQLHAAIAAALEVQAPRTQQTLLDTLA